MDLVLDYLDETVFSPFVYPESFPPDDIRRQTLSLTLITLFGAYFFYFVFSTLNYYLIFNHEIMKHKLFLPNQISQEIQHACFSIPFISALTVPIFIAQVRGYSKLYDDFQAYSSLYWVVSVLSFALFTDGLIYWIHRWEHHPFFYKTLHKSHHKWVIPTPFASLAFNPLDSFAQSTPYYLFIFLFPFHKTTWLLSFVFINFWTISIHDGLYMVPTWLEPYVNGAAHHTDHHLLNAYNYGQYFTLWDRLGGTWRSPWATIAKQPKRN